MGVLSRKEKEGVARKLLGWSKEKVLQFIDAHQRRDSLPPDAITNLKAEVEAAFTEGGARRQRCCEIVVQALY